MDSKTLMNIFGVVALGSLAIGYMNKTQEDYIQDITYSTFREAVPLQSTDFVMSKGQYQANVAPRAVGNGLEKAVYNNLPDVAYMGVDPASPMVTQGCKVKPFSAQQMAGMVTKENFDPANPLAVQQATFSLPNDAYIDSVPVGTMDTIQPDGQVEQVVVYDRFMMTNYGSNTLRGGVNYIAGDIPIAPLENSVFGNPSNATPATDLFQGALFAIAGVDNSTAKDLYSLTSKYKGGTQRTFAGATVADQKIFKQAAAASGVSTDVVVTAFP